MLERLKNLIEKSQTPYYHFPVACILECRDGSYYEGVNVETSSPAAGICAERNALFQALAQGKKKEDFQTLYLYHQSNQEITPCFICRQALIDYCDLDLKIIVYNERQEIKTYQLRELCPNAFDKESLQ